MIAVRVTVETRDGVSEYIAHVNNRSKHALSGAVRNGWRRYPTAKAITAQYIKHDCAACHTEHTVPTIRRVYHRKRGAA